MKKIILIFFLWIVFLGSIVWENHLKLLPLISSVSIFMSIIPAAIISYKFCAYMHRNNIVRLFFFETIMLVLGITTLIVAMVVCVHYFFNEKAFSAFVFLLIIMIGFLRRESRIYINKFKYKRGERILKSIKMILPI